MTRKLILGIVVMLSLTMVSCGSITKNIENEQNSTSSSSALQEDKNADSTSSKDTIKEENKTNNNDTSSKDTDNTIKFSVYKVDENSLEPNEIESISINKDASLKDKLIQLAKSVSKANFDGLPIEIKSIDTINGKKIATINLADSNNKTWVSKFQGSTGGQVTAGTLIENFLQTNNKSNTEWIDGVKFLYKNETIEYDHVSDLSNIQYRY
ncbi:MAG: hypothetical protein E7207_06820 [Clostridium butyricum]|nr:hypothetical protein [Clostridium butyricum]